MPHTPRDAPTRAMVWLDHREARIFLITPEDVEKRMVAALDGLVPK